MKEKQKFQEEMIASLEGKLSRVFQPVAPSERFVDHVRSRISIASPRIVVQRLNDTQYILVVLGGVLSMLLLIITGTRALYYLFARK